MALNLGAHMRGESLRQAFGALMKFDDKSGIRVGCPNDPKQGQFVLPAQLNNDGRARWQLLIRYKQPPRTDNHAGDRNCETLAVRSNLHYRNVPTGHWVHQVSTTSHRVTTARFTPSLDHSSPGHMQMYVYVWGSNFETLGGHLNLLQHVPYTNQMIVENDLRYIKKLEDGPIGNGVIHVAAGLPADHDVADAQNRKL